ncbi:hypothetical protein [Caldimonas tepidiphila]|uniref:hypothetical protein n=1 Tax=Caldimonas tepidiphila TaxID=2315841 RepID=UPI000E5C52DD|nr:hypothetical protein [Caldimonas tepidiphila]
MGNREDVVTDGKVELRADWEEPSATLFWRPHDEAPARTPGVASAARDGWQPSIYQVGDFDHDHARALRVMSALWRFMEGSSRQPSRT